MPTKTVSKAISIAAKENPPITPSLILRDFSTLLLSKISI